MAEAGSADERADAKQNESDGADSEIEAPSAEVATPGSSEAATPGSSEAATPGSSEGAAPGQPTAPVVPTDEGTPAA